MQYSLLRQCSALALVGGGLGADIGDCENEAAVCGRLAS